MSYTLKTENYQKAPSAEMRNLWRIAWQQPPSEMPTTRIEFSLKVKEILAGPEREFRKIQLTTWREARKAARAQRAAERTTRRHEQNASR